MKTYVYNYRNTDGMLKQGSLQAINRGDAIRRINENGHILVAINEGNALKKPRISSRFLKPSAVLRIAAVSGVLVTLLVLWHLFKHRKPATIATVPLQASQSPLPHSTTTRPLRASSAMPDHREVTRVAPDIPLEAESPTQTLTPSIFNQQRPSFIIHTPKTETPFNPTIVEEQTLKTPTEQLIGMLGRPGEERPPLPEFPDETLVEDFEKSLRNMIVIKDSDDDETIAHKENVAWIKEYMRKAKEMGWTPAEYLKALEQQRVQEAAERNAAHVLLEEVRKEKPELTKAAREELNADLGNRGILPLEEEED